MIQPSSSLTAGDASFPNKNELAFTSPNIISQHKFQLRTQYESNKNRCTVASPVSMRTDGPRFSRRLLLSMFSYFPLAYAVDAMDIPSDTSDDGNGFRKLPCKGENCRPVEVRDFRLGTGRQVQMGSTVTLKWTGRLADRYGWPYQREGDDDDSFDIARDPLIDGFVQGILGMREGGKRRILIPGELGYKDERTGPLPHDFGDRRRLFATVLNKRRFVRAGDLVIDVQLKRVRP